MDFNLSLKIMLLSTEWYGKSYLTKSLVKDLLSLAVLLNSFAEIFWLKNCEKLLHCKSFPHFFSGEKW